MSLILDFIFPKSCSICCKKGSYLCNRCKKLLIRNLPECYICRKVSKNYKTHKNCKFKLSYSYNSIFVAWQYNKLSSIFLRKYKYVGIYDIKELLGEIIPPLLKDFDYIKGNNLVIPVPISHRRLQERGFNQTEYIAQIIAKELSCTYMNNIIINTDNSSEHQASLSKEERKCLLKNRFSIPNYFDFTSYDNIIIVDDVITTGSTLEEISKCIKKACNKDISLHAFCLFRGKAYYTN